MTTAVKEPPKVHRELACRLTREELDNYRDELAQKISKIHEVEAEKSRVTKDYGARIAELESANMVLARKITNRMEYRQVECAYDFNWTLGLKYLTRRDTFEVVETT